MKSFFATLCLILVSTSPYAGKFDGVSLGASIGGNLASLKERSVTDGFKQLGANGKLYAGIGKSFLDIIFVGAEAFGRYSFFVKAEDVNKGSVDAAPQFGGHIKAGIRPSENLLLYGIYGMQSSSAKIKNAVEKIFEPTDGTWSTLMGAGFEYALGVGIAVRAEGVYEPDTSFKIKDIPDQSYDANFFSINLGIVVYL
ncbi:MAG: outer membrane beta-barrel protein [Alphaproteobacteria bacterium]|nr:outer membrane beta-barrel protein [Alphaproteobacteria bacterium]